MVRRAIFGVSVVVALYALTYVILSASGKYHRFVESFVGPTVSDEWLPRGFTHPAVLFVFWPAYAVDSRFWHPVRREDGWHYVKDEAGTHMLGPGPGAE